MKLIKLFLMTFLVSASLHGDINIAISLTRKIQHSTDAPLILSEYKPMLNIEDSLTVGIPELEETGANSNYVETGDIVVNVAPAAWTGFFANSKQATVADLLDTIFATPAFVHLAKVFHARDFREILSYYTGATIKVFGEVVDKKGIKHLVPLEDKDTVYANNTIYVIVTNNPKLIMRYEGEEDIFGDVAEDLLRGSKML